MFSRDTPPQHLWLNTTNIGTASTSPVSGRNGCTHGIFLSIMGFGQKRSPWLLILRLYICVVFLMRSYSTLLPQAQNQRIQCWLIASMGIGLGSLLRSELSYSIRILRAIASTVSKRIRGTDTVGPPYRGRFFICSMNACHSSSVAFTSLETRSAARTISFCMIYSGRSAEILFRDFAAKSSSLS